MAKVKLTKSVVNAAQPRSADYELRDIVVPGFLCKVTPQGRKVFMVQYRTDSGLRRKPAIGLFGALRVEEARGLAQDWLTKVRHGRDPSAEKAAARHAPIMRDLCDRFMSEHSKVHNKPKTIKANEYRINRYIVPALGHMKVQDVTRADVVELMRKHQRTPTVANHNLSCLRKMFNLAEVWLLRPDGSNPCRHVAMFPRGGKTRLITASSGVSSLILNAPRRKASSIQRLSLLSTAEAGQNTAPIPPSHAATAPIPEVR